MIAPLDAILVRSGSKSDGLIANKTLKRERKKARGLTCAIVRINKQ
jgi:hypothetical protein